MSQYYLLRGNAASPVCASDQPQMILSDLGDTRQATISRWELANSISTTSRPTFMEALPSQQIKFLNATNVNTNNHRKLSEQSKEPFQRFHLNTKGIGK
jgi:hypothetical protein